jgi:L-fucose isomerase-like protein
LGMDFHSPLPEDYNEVYSQTLKEMGPELMDASLIELNEEMGKVDQKEAGRIADMWIAEAKEVRETNREEVLKAARLYLGMERLMAKYGATGIAIRSLVPWVKGMIDVTPCLANTELNRQSRVGVCEGLVNSAITELFGFYVTSNPSFVGDVVGIDRINDTVTFAHCQCPINPHGSDRVPYVIRSHALQKGNKMLPDDYPEAGSTLSAAVQVELPTDETVTAIKFSFYDRKIALSTGVSVPGDESYKDFEDILCRTKLVMKTNSAAFESKYDTATFGVHRNIIYGDHTQVVKDLSKLMGFQPG